MDHPELLADIDTMRKTFEILLPRELERLIAEGTVKPAAREASHETQVYLVTVYCQEMRWLDRKIHDLNLEWNIAEGLY